MNLSTLLWRTHDARPARGPALPRRLAAGLLSACCWLLAASPAMAQAHPLPSWRDSPARQAILSFVTRVTTPGSPDFVAKADRVAVFDNDGTLWSEQPYYFQLAFALHRVEALARAHPERASEQPYRAVLSGDARQLEALGQEGLARIMALSHSGMTTSEFARQVRQWQRQDHHPRFQRPYTDLVFQPMLELLAHLEANGFRNYIVSGGGVDFMRAWAPAVYGIPPERIIGTTGALEFRLDGDQATLHKLDDIAFVDDGPGKPVAIHRTLGRVPILAVGNSDGDLQMLQWTTLQPGARLGLIVHHTDAEREWAYDRDATVGRLDQALTEAGPRGWWPIDMQRDWQVVYPFQSENPRSAPE